MALGIGDEGHPDAGFGGGARRHDRPGPVGQSVVPGGVQAGDIEGDVAVALPQRGVAGMGAGGRRADWHRYW